MARLHMKADERADVFCGLANQWRRRVIDHLRDGPLPFDAIQRVVPVKQATLSEHLATLRDCGLVDVSLAGNRTVYRLRPRAMKAAERWIVGST